MTNIEVLRIKYYDLLKILDNYPTIKENMNNVSIQREKGNNEAKIIAKKAGFKMDREKLKCVQGLIGANHYEDLFNVRYNIYIYIYIMLYSIKKRHLVAQRHIHQAQEDLQWSSLMLRQKM